LHLIYKDLAFVFTEYCIIDLFIGSKANSGSIQKNRLTNHFPISTNLHSFAIDDILSLILINHIEMIRICDKVKVKRFVWHEAHTGVADQIHVQVIHGKHVLPSYTFIDHILLIYLSEYFKRYLMIVFIDEVGINNFLCR
jgi:hypothetical protein